MKLDTVTRNYDRLAPFYDFWDRWLSRPLADIDTLRDQTVARLELCPGDEVLDIGCGTGLNLGRLVDAVGPTGRVVGLDYSDGMLDQARDRVRGAGWTNVELVRGDAATLAGVAGPFDAVLSTWALGIVEDLPAALRAAVAALRPGARLAVLDLHRTRTPSGLRRWVVDPILHALLRCAGVDSAEDLDDARLRRRWGAGKAFLRGVLVDVCEEENVDGAGFLLWGRAPRGSPRGAGRAESSDFVEQTTGRGSMVSTLRQTEPMGASTAACDHHRIRRRHPPPRSTGPRR